MTALEASVVALQDGHRIAHSRISDLEAKMTESTKYNAKLEERLREALTTAEKAHTDLEAKTSSAFSKAHEEYAKEVTVKSRINVIEHRIEEMHSMVQSLRGQVPQAQPQQPSDPRSPAADWWREAEPAPASSPAAGSIGAAVQAQGAPSAGQPTSFGPGQQDRSESPLGPNSSAQAEPTRQAAMSPSAVGPASQDPFERSDPWRNPHWGRAAASGSVHEGQQGGGQQHQSPLTPPQSWQHEQRTAYPQGGTWFPAGSPGPAQNQWNVGNAGPAPNFGQGFGTPYGHRQLMGNQERMDSKSENLKRFTGNPEGFKSWADRIIDHMGKVHPAWRSLLQWMAKTEDDLSMRRLRRETFGPHDEQAADLAVKFEQFLVDWLPETLYCRRGQLSGGPGEENNGFIMWRRLHHDNIGLEVHIANAGVDCLREYGKCEKMSNLLAHLDGWRDLYQQYGQELDGAPNYVRSMYLEILPKELRTEISREDKLEFASWRTIDSWVRKRCMVLQTESLAAINKRILAKEVKGKISAIMPAEDDDDDEEKQVRTSAPSAAAVPPEVTAMLKKLEDSVATIAAIQKKAGTGGPPARRGNSPGRGRSPGRGNGPRARSSSNSRRLVDWGNKCFHCGSDKHRRPDCEDFIKMMKRANPGVTDPKKWKAPQGYESAIAKARKAAKAKEDKKSGSVNAIQPGTDTASEDESNSDTFSQAGMFSYEQG